MSAKKRNHMKNACPFKVRYKLCPDIKKLAKGNDTTATNKLIRKTKVGTIFANSLRTQNDLQVFLSHSGVSVAIILCSLCTTFAFHFTVTFTDMFQFFLLCVRWMFAFAGSICARTYFNPFDFPSERSEHS